MREAALKRETSETKVEAELKLDGNGKHSIDTGIGFFNHMLELFAKHSSMDINVKVSGDTYVDFHHSVEDCGIVLGKVFAQALGDKKGIERYADISLPMDETLVVAALDISGRAYLHYKSPDFSGVKCGDFDAQLAEEFFRAFAYNAEITLHLNLVYGTNTHHIIEAFFKATARVLRKAVAKTGDELPSTKGVL